MRAWVVSAFLAVVFVALAPGAASRSGPLPKSISANVLLDYYSEAPGAGELEVRFSGAAKVSRPNHRSRFFRLETYELRVLRSRLARVRGGYVHAKDGYHTVRGLPTASTSPAHWPIDRGFQ